MNKFLCLLILAMAAWITSWSQDNTFIDISGKVFDADSLSAIPSVFIYVPGQKTDSVPEIGAISNENGFFSITIKPADTLIFSAVNYLSKIYVLPDSLRKGRPYIEVPLTLRTIKLKEVVVKGHLNPAAVRRYLDNVNRKRRDENPPDIYRNKSTSEPITTPEGRKHTVSLGSSTKPEGGVALEGVLTGLANLFNRRAQQQKRIAVLLEARKNREAQEAYRDFIKSKFNEELVAEATGLKGHQLEEFLAYCNLSDEFIYYATEYELLEAIFSRYYRFLKYE